MIEWLAVFLGGGLGSISRFGMGKWIGVPANGFPLPTLLINVGACLVLGIVAGFVVHKGQFPAALKLGITVGFCGGFSTFSTFSLEAFSLYQGGKMLVMAAYILASVVLCFMGIALGQWLGRQF